MPEQVKKEMNNHMEQTVEVLKSALSKIQTGRANLAMIEAVRIDYYGTATPLNQMATIAAPDAHPPSVPPSCTRRCAPDQPRRRRRPATRSRRLCSFFSSPAQLPAARTAQSVSG